MRLRMLSEAGTQEFRNFLAEVRAGSANPVPSQLLEDLGTSAPLPGNLNIEIDHPAYTSKAEMARDLVERMRPLPLQVLREQLGMWSWLALFFFDQLAPASAVGTRKLLANELYIPTSDYQRKYRHLLLGPCMIYRLRGEAARLLLTKPLHIWSDLEEQLIGVQEIIQIPGALEAADLLYFDPASGEPKRGVTNRKKGGTVRRLREVLQQLDVTYDVFSLSGDQVLALLPGEFDRFKPSPP